MTDVLIKRELLEQVASEFENDNDRYMLGRELRKVLAAPRQPEGEGLEVVAWNITVKMDGRTWSEYTEKLPFLPDAKVTWHSEPEPVCRLSDAQSAIAELREECERLRGECARLESKYERDVWGLNNEGDPIGGDHPSGFANDLLRVTIERDTLRQQLAERDAQIASMRAEVTPFIETHWMPVARQRDKLADLLDEVTDDFVINHLDAELVKRIDAALVEVNK